MIAFFHRRHALSGEIRRQAATAIGAPVNPTAVPPSTLGIGVKLTPMDLWRSRRIPLTAFRTYALDLLDYDTGLRELRAWPDLPVIVCSLSAERWLRAHVPNPLTFIPQHHCNVERTLRPDRPVRRVSYIGLSSSPPVWADRVNEAVRKMGLEMQYITRFRTRHDVVAAYLSTDIQFQWCEGMADDLAHIKNPMRVLSGLSFGIPMVANPLPAYQAECGDLWLMAPTLSDALDRIRDLSTDPDLYGRFRTLGPPFAEPYHLDHVAPLFTRLEASWT